MFTKCSQIQAPKNGKIIDVKKPMQIKSQGVMKVDADGYGRSNIKLNKQD